jgi:hypothetical protein
MKNTRSKAGSQDVLVSRRRTIELGAMSPKLSQQLDGLKVPRKRLRVLDKLSESLTWCYLHHLITEAEHNRASRRLLAKVQDEVTKGANASPSATEAGR